MRFVQKRAGLTAQFEFGEEDLSYVFSRSGIKSGSSVTYHRIPLYTSRREVKPWWIRYFTVSYLVFCGLITVFPEGLERQILTLYFATLLYLFITLCGLLRSPGTLITFTLNPPLLVLDDGRGAEVLEAISRHRRDAMRKHLVRIDETRPYYEEAGKMNWLREEGIISAQEYRALRDKIALMRDRQRTH